MFGYDRFDATVEKLPFNLYGMIDLQAAPGSRETKRLNMYQLIGWAHGVKTPETLSCYGDLLILFSTFGNADERQLLRKHAFSSKVFGLETPKWPVASFISMRLAPVVYDVKEGPEVKNARDLVKAAKKLGGKGTKEWESALATPARCITDLVTELEGLERSLAFAEVLEFLEKSLWTASPP